MGPFVHLVKNSTGSFVHGIFCPVFTNCISGETVQTMTGSLCIDISSLLVNVVLNRTITGKEQSQDTIRICRMHLDHGCTVNSDDKAR